MSEVSESAAHAATTRPRPGVASFAARVAGDQRAGFAAVGVANTAINLGVYALLVKVAGVPYLAALGIAWGTATVCAFVLHRTFVFRVRGHVVRDFLRFVSVNITAVGANAVLLPVFVTFASPDPVVAQLEVVVVITLASFFAHRHFSFRRSG